jgi:hypothetical protein
MMLYRVATWGINAKPKLYVAAVKKETPEYYILAESNAGRFPWQHRIRKAFAHRTPKTALAAARQTNAEAIRRVQKELARLNRRKAVLEALSVLKRRES